MYLKSVLNLSVDSQPKNYWANIGGCWNVYKNYLNKNIALPQTRIG